MSLIDNLHAGMNLRDPDPSMQPGETKESLGCDFSRLGQVRPMRQSALTLVLPYDIHDAHMVYIGGIAFLFTTHNDGLRVTTSGKTMLIHPQFMGKFKVLSLNDTYMVLANSSLNIKWQPYQEVTSAWGLNKPPLPTLAAGAAGTLSGDYYIAVAYQNDLGNYGPFTAYAGPVSLTNQKLVINGLTPDTDPQTTQRRIAITGGGLTDPFVFFVEDNTSTSFTYDGPLTGLTDIEGNFNNTPPPVGIVDMKEWNGWIFLVLGDSSIHYSVAGQFYEAFPANNYILTEEGEQLFQVDVIGQLLAARGKGREHYVQIIGTDPTLWVPFKGAEEGAQTSRLLLTDLSGAHIYAARQGLYMSGNGSAGYYLPKINTAIADPSEMFGDMISDRAYVYFKDTSGVDRIMRIDYRLGIPLAHYVMNLKPAAIIADRYAGKVYYALGREVYEFEGGSGPLPTSLNTGERLFDTTVQKDYATISYDLSNGPLEIQFSMDGDLFWFSLDGGFSMTSFLSLQDAKRRDTPTSLPAMQGGQLGLILSSTTQDWLLKLPIDIQVVPLGNQ